MRKLKTQQAEMRRRAERFLSWAGWHAAHRGTLTDEKCARELTDVLLGAGRYLRRDSVKEHKRLVDSMQGAMPAVLEASKDLPAERRRQISIGPFVSSSQVTMQEDAAVRLRKALDKLNHAVTRALIREGL